MTNNDLIYWLALHDKRKLIPHYLLDYINLKFGNLEEFWYSDKDEMLNIGLTEIHARNFINYANYVKLDKYAELLKDIKKCNMKIIRYIDSEYPDKLKISGIYTYEPPILIFKKGKKINVKKSVAIVGTRKASNYAKEKARLFARELAKKGYTIISGLARGIDYEAHCGALDVENGKTIAVLAWMKPIYPPDHEKLAKRIEKNGCLLSENFISSGSKYSFIQRNRITSGLSDFVIAVESGSTGGTIRQVDFAISQRRPTYTIYPNIHSSPEIIKGFNTMVEKGVKPIENINDIKYIEYDDMKLKISTITGNLIGTSEINRKFEDVRSVINSKEVCDFESLVLIYGYDEYDAINRIKEKYGINIDVDNVKIMKLSAQDRDENLKLKYYLIDKIKLPKKKNIILDRPNCPYCGIKKIISRGHSWNCKKCGRYFKK